MFFRCAGTKDVGGPCDRQHLQSIQVMGIRVCFVFLINDVILNTEYLDAYKTFFLYFVCISVVSYEYNKST